MSISSDEQTPTDPLADLIAAHQPVVSYRVGGWAYLECTGCDWGKGAEHSALDHAPHRRHLAAVVRASGTTTSECPRCEGTGAENDDDDPDERTYPCQRCGGSGTTPAASGVPLGGTTREHAREQIAEAVQTVRLGSPEGCDCDLPPGRLDDDASFAVADAVLALRPDTSAPPTTSALCWPGTPPLTKETTMRRQIAGIALALGLILGAPSAAVADDSYVPGPTTETVLPGPTWTPEPAPTVKPAEGELPQTGADGVVWIGAGAVVLVLAGYVLVTRKPKENND